MREVFIYKRDGKITNAKVLKKAFSELEDGAYLIKIESKRKRSLQQNKYYWLIVCEMVAEGLKDVGYNEVQGKQDAHEIMKSLFLKRQIVNHESGDIIEIPGSTKKLTTVEFGEYIQRIQQWASEYLFITIPDPNQQTEFFTSVAERDNINHLTVVKKG